MLGDQVEYSANGYVITHCYEDEDIFISVKPEDGEVFRMYRMRESRIANALWRKLCDIIDFDELFIDSFHIDDEFTSEFIQEVDVILE